MSLIGHTYLIVHQKIYNTSSTNKFQVIEEIYDDGEESEDATHRKLGYLGVNPDSTTEIRDYPKSQA